jgi:hypothetical protein
VLVEILSPPEAMKPGMNASVTIQVKYEPDVVQAPLQTVYGVQGRHFVLVKSGEKNFETREIEVNGNNSQVVWIESGLEPGDQLVMNPGAYKERMELPEVAKDSKIELPEGAVPVSTAANASESDGDGPPQGEGPGNQVAGGPGAGGGPGGGGGGGPGGGGRGGRGGGGGGGFGDPSAMVDRMMERFDTNADGKLDSSELSSLPGSMAENLPKADKDGDGSITREEFAAYVPEMMKQFSQRMGNGGGPGGGGFGGGGPGGGTQ